MSEVGIAPSEDVWEARISLGVIPLLMLNQVKGSLTLNVRASKGISVRLRPVSVSVAMSEEVLVTLLPVFVTMSVELVMLLGDREKLPLELEVKLGAAVGRVGAGILT